MRRTKTDASLVILLAIVILLGAGVFFTIYILRSDPIGEALSENRVINTLFVIEQDGKPLSSYVLMFYPGTKRAAIFDIPGELGLIVKQVNRVDRIDLVYDSRDISAFEAELEALLGIEIGYSFVITTENLGKLVDLIEGVDILIPSPVAIYDADEPILFPSGKIRLDGDKARLYVTYELPEEDREMAAFRRQRFFLGFIKRLGEMNVTLKNPAEARLLSAGIGASMNQRTRTRLFDEYTGIDTDRTNVQSVGGNFRVISGQTLLIPYYDGNLVKEIIRQSLGSLTRQAEGSLSERVFTVEVLNGTPVNGLAGRTAELLRSFGYDVISIGNADRDDYETTEIIDRTGYEEPVKTFGDVIRCGNIRLESPVSEEITGGTENELRSFEYRSDFTLIIGRDFNGRYVTGG